MRAICINIYSQMHYRGNPNIRWIVCRECQLNLRKGRNCGQCGWWNRGYKRSLKQGDTGR